jgi:hypothetical protein
VKQVRNIKAKATSKHEQYDAEKEQNYSRQDSNRSCDIDHTANEDIVIGHSLVSKGRFGSTLKPRAVA